MATLYLLGGENVLNRSAKEVNQHAFEVAGRSPEVLVFTWARASFDKIYRKRKLLSDYLLSLGAGTVSFVEYGESRETISRMVAKSALIYLSGGQPSILIERLKVSGVDYLLKDYRGVIVGRSAGALALCDRCVATCRSNGRVRIVQGIGLAGITLKAHYISEDDLTLQQLSVDEVIYAVPQSAALICQDNTISAMGKVYFFSEGKRYEFKSGQVPSNVNL